MTRNKRLYAEFILDMQNDSSLLSRRMHLYDDEIKRYHDLMRKAERFVSPYRKPNCYWAIVESLSILGENEPHIFHEVLKEIKRNLSCPTTKDRTGQTSWDKFTNKQPQSVVAAFDVQSKIYQNIYVLQRLGGITPYGLKLVQLHACVDILIKDGEKYICLRTRIPYGEIVKPINQTRKNKRRTTNKNAFFAGCTESNILAQLEDVSRY